MKKILEKIKEDAKRHNIPIMEKDPAKLLYDTVKLRQSKNILEIGTAIGYSGLLMLKASPSAHLTTIELDRDRLTQARQNFEKAGVKDRVRCIEDDANFVVSIMEGEYDFVLLDGPKSHYSTMLEYLLRLLTHNGMIFIDDILYHGYIEGTDYPMHKHRTIITSLRKLIADVQSNTNLKSEIIKAGDGVMLIQKVN